MPEFTRIGKLDGWIGSGLNRPECVVAHRSGLLLAPNWTGNGGCSVINPAGATHHLLANDKGGTLRPNGIALESGGSILLAHLGESTGGIYRLFTSGEVEPIITTADSQPLPPTNFVVKDSKNRIWITVSTRKIPRARDYHQHACTGFIAMAEPGQSNATIVADGLGYTNECVIDEFNNRLYVNETFARRLSTFNLDDLIKGKPSEKQVYSQFGGGMYPDGLAMDTEGNLWVTSIISNRILRVTPDGKTDVVFEDSIATHLEITESAYRSSSLGREHLDNAGSSIVKNISNIAFAGPSRSRIYIGNLLGDALPYLDTESQGIAMPHWDAELGELENYL
jgi:sugar lactone lactonase YvrE